MLRAVLLGILAVSAAASCSKKADAPSAAVGVAAGKVVEITGKVDATREGKTRTLALGSGIFGDDQIATSADATVAIELFHNNAKWSVVSNKVARVDASLAWGLDKQEASKAVEHNSAAAGRNAERSAADTSSTTGAQAPTAPPVTVATVDPTAATPAPMEQSRGGKGGGGGERADKNMAPGRASQGTPAPGPSGGSPPPPPPPPPPVRVETKSAPTNTQKTESFSADEAPRPLDKDKETDDKVAVVITPRPA